MSNIHVRSEQDTTLALAAGAQWGAAIHVASPGRAWAAWSRLQQKPHLRLEFDDKEPPESPLPGPQRKNFKFATVDDVKAAIEFARKNASADLLICCERGISRSASIALVVLCDRLGRGNEQGAGEQLLDINNRAWPNMHVAKLGDKILGRDGAIVRVADMIDVFQKNGGDKGKS